MGRCGRRDLILTANWGRHETYRTNPVQVMNADGTSLSGVVGITAGYNYTVYLKSDGTVWATGQNSKGQLGDFSNTDRKNPVYVSSYVEKLMDQSPPDGLATPENLVALSTLSIAENQPVGTSISDFNASAGAGNSLTYSLVSGEGDSNNALFDLDGNGTLKTEVIFDFETNASSYSIRVRATNEHNFFTEESFTITLLNLNEAPTSLSAVTGLNIAENQPVGTVVGELSAIDPDGGAITYSLVSGRGRHNSLFKIIIDHAEFDPTTLSSLKLWLDANDSSSITQSSGAVSQWADKSGNGNHATQSTSTKQPSLVANKVVFDGTDDHIISEGLNVTQPYSFFIVGKTNNNSSGRDYLFDGVGSTSSHRSLIALDNGGKIQMWAGSWANTNVNTPTSDFVLSAVFNTSNSTFALNGTSVTGLNVGSYNLTNGITIGANHLTNTDFFDGNIAEFIILAETSSAETQIKIEGYLAHKWGLLGNMPSNHSAHRALLVSDQVFDFENNASSYTIRVEAKDEYNATTEKSFTIQLLDTFEHNESSYITHSASDLEMIWVQPGTFTMGQSDITDASPEHNVTLTKGFYLGKYEVTQSEYEAVMTGVTGDLNATPSNWHGYPNRPVEKVSWDDVQVFLSRINAQEAGNIPAGWAYVLPTEAQWEYACAQARPRHTRWGIRLLLKMQIIIIPSVKQPMWDLTVPTPGAFLICTVMCGNLLQTGTHHIPILLKLIQWDPQMEPTLLAVAVL